MHRILLLAALLALAPTAFAGEVPSYLQCRLDALFPAGGQRGQQFVVTINGYGSGLKDAREVIIDGPPGVAVKSLKNVNDNVVEATLDIAADAVPGRRMIRVRSDQAGVTNMLYFL